jgi:hypothetical protein
MAAAILCLTGWSGVRVWKKLNVRLLKHESAGHYRRFHAFKLSSNKMIIWEAILQE